VREETWLSRRGR